MTWGRVGCILSPSVHEDKVMKNVEMQVDGDKLTITVDLSKEFGPSSSGKTIIVASSEGNQTIEYKNGEYKLGLNIFRKP